MEIDVGFEECRHLHSHKQTRRIFICIDASLTCLALAQVFLLSEIVSYFFSFSVLTVAFLFNGYALYSYRMLEQRHRDVVLNERWIARWTTMRAAICCFEWSIYLVYLFFIGSPILFYHWLLFFVGFVPIAAGYYELEKIEHDVGIHSMVVHVQKQREKQQIIAVESL